MIAPCAYCCLYSCSARQGRRRSIASAVREAPLGLTAAGSWQPITAALHTSKETLGVLVLQAPA